MDPNEIGAHEGWLVYVRYEKNPQFGHGTARGIVYQGHCYALEIKITSHEQTIVLDPIPSEMVKKLEPLPNTSELEQEVARALGAERRQIGITVALDVLKNSRFY